MMRFSAAMMATVLSCVTWAAKPEFVTLYLDADRTGHLESAQSIEQGVKVALAEVDNQLNGVPVRFVVRDHRGNVKRSKRHMDEFLRDANALVFVAGMHSPPLIKYRDFINQQGILTLVPWAAGTPITRSLDSDQNFIFRLSVDDSKVGGFLLNVAFEQGCSVPHLVLENTGWGKSNYKAMMRALPSDVDAEVKVSWFDWGIQASDARNIVRQAQQDKAQCLLLVGNAREGKNIVDAVAELNASLPVYSHWGITGGQFAQNVPFEVREKAQLTFVQSCFNFYSNALTPFQTGVFERASRLFPEHFTSTNIQAPAGFVHGYDLTRVLIAAANRIEWQQEMPANRRALKVALESLETPVQGLVKRYQHPFSPISRENMDAHEALSAQDLCMAMYDEHDGVKLRLTDSQ